MLSNPYDFDIDVDISPLLGPVAGETLINSHWYELCQPRPGRSPELQAKLERIFRNRLLGAQWSATARRSLDRRRAVRVPLLSRIHVDPKSHLVSCDISLSGLRCSGVPPTPLMDVEFKVPGADFPIDARVEVVSFKDSNVVPLVGMRFAQIDRPYLDFIARYVARRRERTFLAA